ncbi:NAD(P)H-hydrate dehydratase [Thalassiella azotivora]
MIDAHGVAAVRRAEEAAMRSAPEGVLMQRAAAGLAAVLAGTLRRTSGGVSGRRVVLLVGPGANGGDAMWAGARLARRGAAVTAVLTSGSTHPEGLRGLQRAGGRVLDLHDRPDAVGPGAGRRLSALLSRADVVVDGLLGIGGRAGLRPPAAQVVRTAELEVPDGVPLVAVDLPSGVDPDTGTLGGPAVRADLTVTFGTAKPCLLLPPACLLAGDVVVVDIGLDPTVLGPPAVRRLEREDVTARWPVPSAEDDKYSRGVVGVVAGGPTYTGAALLAAGAAVRAGAGMVRYLGPQAPTDLVRARWPEVVPGAGRVQAWVLGPGVDPGDADQADRVRSALASPEPAVVDAGALDLLAGVLSGGGPVGEPGRLLLTPHAGELARLLTALEPAAPTAREDVLARPAEHAARACRLTGAVVLLKGATALVAAPDGALHAQPDGPHWMATAGSGDVLAGLAGTLLAAGLAPADAGALAVAVHAAAGHRASAGGPVSAGTVLDAVPGALADLLAGALPD